MNSFLISVGAGTIAFIIMQCYGAAKFEGGSNGTISFFFALGITMLIAGLLT